MKAGAVDFLTKPVDQEKLLAAVRIAIGSDRSARAAREARLHRPGLAALTPREREVMAQVVAGKLNKQIAAELGTAEKTVKVHRARVMKQDGRRLGRRASCCLTLRTFGLSLSRGAARFQRLELQLVGDVVLVDVAHVAHRLVADAARRHQLHVVEPHVRVEPVLCRLGAQRGDARPSPAL